MGNFDYLKKEKRFAAFSDVAISTEKLLYDPGLCVVNCRRAMEFAIKWMYSVDASLTKPYQDNLVSLMNTEEFRNIIRKADKALKEDVGKLKVPSSNEILLSASSV